MSLFQTIDLYSSQRAEAYMLQSKPLTGVLEPVCLSGRCVTLGNRGVALLSIICLLQAGNTGSTQGQVQSIRICTACWPLLGALAFVLYVVAFMHTKKMEGNCLQIYPDTVIFKVAHCFFFIFYDVSHQVSHIVLC